MNFRFLFITLFIPIIFCAAQDRNECYRIFSDSASGTALYGYKNHNNVIKSLRSLSQLTLTTSVKWQLYWIQKKDGQE